MTHNVRMGRKRNEAEKPVPPATTDKRSGSRHKDRHTLSIRGEVYRNLATLAKRNNRPLLWEARIALENHLAANGLAVSGSDDESA